MPIDNELYDREGETWWDEDNPLNMLHGSITPGRFGYFQKVLTERLRWDPRELQALDVGCGGGFLSEEFAKLGCHVVGVDPSSVSIETARRHAAANCLDVDYRVGFGEELPVPDGAFDVVYCCDVLEHVSDLAVVAAEISRALKPDGAFFFDTVNRTLTSKILGIKVMQEWRLTRVFDTAVHEWDMFIKPEELTRVLAGVDLRVDDLVGLGFRASKPMAVLDFVRAQRGRLSYGELSRRLDAGPVRSKSMSYMGFATKAG